jgi:hypothetical protein
MERTEPEEPVRVGPDWGPLQVPANLENMLEAWLAYDKPKIGWCLLCDSPIESEHDLIQETNTHNCPAGRRLEEEHNRRIRPA